MTQIVCITCLSWLFLAAAALADDLPAGDTEQAEAIITVEQAKEMLIQKPSIVTDIDRGFVTAASLYGDKLPDFFRTNLKVTEHPVDGLAEALGFQVFGFELPGHCEDLFICNDEMIQRLDFYGSSHVSRAALIKETLYVTSHTKFSVGFVKVSLDEESKLVVERQLAELDSSWNERNNRDSQAARQKRIKSITAVKEVCALVRDHFAQLEAESAE